MRAAPPARSASPLPIPMRLDAMRREPGSADGVETEADGGCCGPNEPPVRFPKAIVLPLQEPRAQLMREADADQ